MTRSKHEQGSQLRSYNMEIRLEDGSQLRLQQDEIVAFRLADLPPV